MGSDSGTFRKSDSWEDTPSVRCCKTLAAATSLTDNSGPLAELPLYGIVVLGLAELALRERS